MSVQLFVGLVHELFVCCRVATSELFGAEKKSLQRQNPCARECSFNPSGPGGVFPPEALLLDLGERTLQFHFYACETVSGPRGVFPLEARAAPNRSSQQQLLADISLLHRPL